MRNTAPKISELKAIITVLMTDDERVDRQLITQISQAQGMNEIERLMSSYDQQDTLAEAISIYFRS